LIIDELNRAHLDKAFGELFTVLGTDDLVPVSLPHQVKGNKLLVIPRRFRIIATLNSYDRQFVNNMSQAIRRRFTFITIDIPEKKPSGEFWEIDKGANLPSLKEFYYICTKACSRVARRQVSNDENDYDVIYKDILHLLNHDLKDNLIKLMELLESIRYSSSESIPYLPIGTAQIIDTVELFLIHYLQSDRLSGDANVAIDWATSVKIIPLFEADTIDQEILTLFAKSLANPFHKLSKRELSVIANAGLCYID
jgi:5-methylcytosine-specific restriction protein B